MSDSSPIIASVSHTSNRYTIPGFGMYGESLYETHYIVTINFSDGTSKQEDYYDDISYVMERETKIRKMGTKQIYENSK